MYRELSKPIRREFLFKLILIGVFLGAYALFVDWQEAWRPGLPSLGIGPFELALLGLATFRLGRLVAYDHVAEPLRFPFTKTVPDPSGAGETVEPRGVGVQRCLGQLVSCPICVGTWIAAGLVYALVAFPGPARIFLLMMAAVGLAELLHAATEILSWSGQAARVRVGRQAVAVETGDWQAQTGCTEEPVAPEKSQLAPVSLSSEMDRITDKTLN
jgi:hypothetical protein